VFSFLCQLATYRESIVLSLAAERRDAVLLAASAPGGRLYRSLSPTFRAHSSKPATTACSGGFAVTDRWTDRQTDTVPLHRPRSAYYVGSADIVWKSCSTFSLSREMTIVIDSFVTPRASSLAVPLNDCRDANDLLNAWLHSIVTALAVSSATSWYTSGRYAGVLGYWPCYRRCPKLRSTLKRYISRSFWSRKQVKIWQQILLTRQSSHIKIIFRFYALCMKIKEIFDVINFIIYK